MPVSKNNFRRYFILNECFTSRVKRYWSKAELIKKIADHDILVNARTLDYDIESMRHDERLGYFAPIAYCKINKGYYYTDPSYSIDKFPLKPEDMKAITFATATLRQYKGIGLVSDFGGAADKIIKVFDRLKHSTTPAHAHVLEFEKMPSSKGIEFVDRIYDAIQEKLVLNITYTKYNQPASATHIFHPYLLKEYKNRWYVLGLQQNMKIVLTLALDRIDAIAEVSKPYIENKLLNPDEYFYHTLGVTHTRASVEDIHLHCSPFLSNYIRTQPLHHTQQIISEDEQGMDIQLKLKPNPELLSLILSYGDDMEVISPLALRQQVGEKLKSAWGKYK